MIFVLRQIQKKCREHNVGLYADFVDLNKAFNTISRDGLWKFLALLCCTPKFLTILLQLHEGHQGQVKYNGSLSGSFLISSGVKQGYVLTPTLFSIFFSIMFLEKKKKKKDLPDGIYICFRTDSSLFNFWRLLARAKKKKKINLGTHL